MANSIFEKSDLVNRAENRPRNTVSTNYEKKKQKKNIYKVISLIMI